MIKNKTKVLLVLLTALLLCTMSYAQSINLYYTDASNASYNLQDIRKINYTGDTMNLQFTDGTIYSWNINTLSKFQYDLNALSAPELINFANIMNVIIYPNPTINLLQININLKLEEDITIALYDLQGKIILEKKLGKQNFGEHQQTLEMKNIPPGSYDLMIIGKKNTIIKKIINL